jgi:hypothetical protein
LICIETVVFGTGPLGDDIEVDRDGAPATRAATAILEVEGFTSLLMVWLPRVQDGAEPRH